MDYEWAQVYVEIVIDAIAHDTLGIESGGVGGVDFLAVHLEGDFPATHHDAQLVHGLAGRISLDDRVVVGPVRRHRGRRVTGDAPLHQELAVSPHQEIGIPVLRVAEMTAADKQSVPLRVTRIHGLRERRDDAVVACSQVPVPPQDDGGSERRVQAGYSYSA